MPGRIYTGTMTTAQVSTGGKERQVGQVHVEITVTNLRDENFVSGGYLGPEAIRSETIRDVLVDAGAMGLCLPADLVARLGLRPVREVQVETAAGRSTMRIMRDVSLEVLGRMAPFECLETPTGTLPLLGAVPMQILGLQPDLRREELVLLPDFGPGTYLRA